MCGLTLRNGIKFSSVTLFCKLASSCSGSSRARNETHVSTHAQVHERSNGFKNVWGNEIFRIPSLLYKYERAPLSLGKQSIASTHSRAIKSASEISTAMLRSLAVLLLYCIASATMSLVFVVLSILQVLPCSRWIIIRLVNLISSVELPTDDYWSSLFTWSMFKSVRSLLLLELQKTAHRGHPAPNFHLVSVDGEKRCRLMDFSKGNRPLVVNFCSWTCPVFRSKVADLLGVMREFSEVADFVTIYIDEAHPSNGWAFKVRDKKILELDTKAQM